MPIITNCHLIAVKVEIDVNVSCAGIERVKDGFLAHGPNRRDSCPSAQAMLLTWFKPVYHTFSYIPDFSVDRHSLWI